MKKIILLLFLSNVIVLTAQNITPSKNINGTYHLLIPEKGVSGKTKKMLIQLGENNGTQMLAVAACKQCFPAIYTYKPELSKKFKKPVFYNSMGYYVITYDKDSFILFVIAISADDDFRYINFYSKDQSKVKTMTKAKMEEYASTILDFI